MQAMPDESPANPSSPTMRRVRRIARWTRGMALLGAVTLPVGTLGLWASPEWIRTVIAREMNLGAEQIIVTPGVQWGGALVSLLPLAIALFALLQVWQLFGDYARGAIFTARATMQLRRLAWSLIGVTAAQVLARTATGIVLTMNNPPGKKMLVVCVSSNDYVLLLFGLLVLAIAWVMVEATRIALEHAEFV